MAITAQIAIILDQLARGPELVQQLIHEVPTELRKRRPAPGVWSAHEHAVHIPAVQPIMMARLDQMLAQPGCTIKSYEPSRDEPDDALLALDLDTEMNRFTRERTAMLDRLRALTPQEWAITATYIFPRPSADALVPILLALIPNVLVQFNVPAASNFLTKTLFTERPVTNTLPS